MLTEIYRENMWELHTVTILPDPPQREQVDCILNGPCCTNVCMYNHTKIRHLNES